MGADAAVEMRTDVTIIALNADSVGISAFDNVTVHRHAATPTSKPEGFSVLRAPTSYVPDGQKEDFGFPAACTRATIVVVDFLLQFFVVHALATTG